MGKCGGSVGREVWNERTIAVVRHVEVGILLKFRHFFEHAEGTTISRSRKRKTR